MGRRDSPALEGVDTMLIIFEMANNHMGDYKHGIRIIDEFRRVADKCPQFEYAFKFQYRDLTTFIHPDADLDNKYAKRFIETNLPLDKRYKLKYHAKDLGFKTICTPFDEKSVQHIHEHDYDMIKVGSPSATDMPLLTEIHYGWPSNKGVILSVGGLSEQEINAAIFTLAREDIILLHCMSEYPNRYTNQGQIGWLMETYPNNIIGFSSHQDPEEYIYLPYAQVYEFHVCTEPAPNKYSLNAERMELVMARLIIEYMQRDPGPKPLQFMRRPQRGDILGRWWWKP
jgi:sialic acid synthase SpsE